MKKKIKSNLIAIKLNKESGTLLDNCAMKLNEPVSENSPVVTPLKISSAVLGQKLSKVESTEKSELLENGANDEDFDHFPDDDEDEDSLKDDDIALTGFIKETKMEIKLVDIANTVGVGGGNVVGGGGVTGSGTVTVGVDNDTAETEEESSTGGKKKGVRKKRSINWEEAERVRNIKKRFLIGFSF